MGNEHCCDDRTKAPDLSRYAVQKVDNRKLEKFSNMEVEKSFEKNTKSKETMPTIQDEKPARNEEVASTSILKHENPPNHIQNQERQESSQSQAGRSNVGSKKSEALDVSKSVNSNLPQSKDVPQLNYAVNKTLKQKKFFQHVKQAEAPTIRSYGGEIYQGSIQNQIPHGFGRFYKKDEGFFIGYFLHGKAHGEGVYIFPDGSYYKGDFVENRAECQKGEYVSEEVKYKGGFKNNVFHGRGEQKGEKHSFMGQYSNGNKASGRLTWLQGSDEYSYQGTFNQSGQFHGKGKLSEPYGNYDGQFQNGQKHGWGIFRYSNQLRYEGDYKFNKREGKGKIINSNNKIAYQGQFHNGMPHGQGYIYDQNGQMHKSTWVEGIDQQII